MTLIKDIFFEKYGITPKQRTQFANERGWGIREAYNPAFNIIIEDFLIKHPDNGLDALPNDRYLFISNHTKSQCYLETCKPSLFYPILDYHLDNSQDKIRLLKTKVFDYLYLLNQHIVFDYSNINNKKTIGTKNKLIKNNYTTHLLMSDDFTNMYDMSNYMHSYSNIEDFTAEDWKLASYDDIMDFCFNFDQVRNNYSVTISDDYNVYAYQNYKVKKNIRHFRIEVNLKNHDDLFIKLLNAHLPELSNLLGVCIKHADQRHVDLMNILIYE